MRIHDIKLGKNQLELKPFQSWLRKKGHHVTRSPKKYNEIDGRKCDVYGTIASRKMETLFVQFTARSPRPIIVQQLTIEELAKNAAEKAGTELCPEAIKYKGCVEYITKDGRTVRVLEAKQ